MGGVRTVKKEERPISPSQLHSFRRLPSLLQDPIARVSRSRAFGSLPSQALCPARIAPMSTEYHNACTGMHSPSHDGAHSPSIARRKPHKASLGDGRNQPG